MLQNNLKKFENIYKQNLGKFKKLEQNLKNLRSFEKFQRKFCKQKLLAMLEKWQKLLIKYRKLWKTNKAILKNIQHFYTKFRENLKFFEQILQK